MGQLNRDVKKASGYTSDTSEAVTILENHKIPFNRPAIVGCEKNFLNKLIDEQGNFAGDNAFSKQCSSLLEKTFLIKNVLLTPSCSHSLDMSAILLNIKEGDEVIMPSFTFVSTANAFVLRGAKIVFIDIREDTLNLDEKLIEDAITEKTKAIVPVHYAGVGCEMDKIKKIAQQYGLGIVEDAAQAISSKYKGQILGTIGDFGTISFHETKNCHCGEGGALYINNSLYSQRAEIIREKGTDRSRFFRGEIDKYGWVDMGSSYLMSELNAAFLYAQLQSLDEIIKKRLALWNRYFENLNNFAQRGCFQIPSIPSHCEHNGHIFYIKTENWEQRELLIKYLKGFNIQSVFHYIPLHSSIAGQKFGRFHGTDLFTTKESDRLLRLPLYYSMTLDEVDFVCEKIQNFFK